MPKENHRAGEMQKACEIGGAPFIPGDESARVLQPGKEPFDFPAAFIAAQADVRSCVRLTRFGRWGAMSSMPHAASVWSSPSLSYAASPIRRSGLSGRKLAFSVCSTSCVSCGDAEAMVMATGRPARSAMAMILVPLPRLVLPTWRPFFGAGKGAIDERLAEIQPAAGVEIGGERLEHAPERPVADPALKAAMTRLIRRIAIRQVLPGRAGAKDPEDAVQHVARIAPRSATSIATHARLR